MINDNFLTMMSKLLNGESVSLPTSLAYGSSVMTVAVDSSSLTGEYASRDSVSNSRSGFTVSFEGVRSGTIASSGGDVLQTFGLYDDSTGGNLLTAVLASSVLHTSSFDLNVEWQFTIGRP
jgi:hypothetical protein